MSRLPCFLVVLLLAAAAAAQQSANPVSAAPQLRQIAILDIPGRPGFESVVFANGKLVMAHHGANTVEIFDPAKRRLVAQVSSIADPRGLAVDAENGIVYIACAGSKSIAVLDAKSWQVTNMIAIGRAPEELLFVPQTHTIYATNPLERSITVITANGQVEALDIQGRPEQMAWDAAQRQLLVSVEDRNAVAVVDPARVHAMNASPGGQSGVVREFPLLASQPTGLVLDPAAHRLYVAVRYAVLELDPDSGAELARVPAPAGTDALWLDSTTSTLYAASVDGSVVQMSTAGVLVAQNEYRAEVRGYAMAYDPQNKTMFLSGGREGRSKLVILKRFGQAALSESRTDLARK